ncbi:hypothetical protein AB0D37_43380, partial [Streptomyces sp. NPDC048384]
MIERLTSFYGFGKMPFGKDLAPQALHRHHAHAQAVARITWCTSEHALGVFTGEAGAGKTVAVRAALAAVDPSAPHHLPGQPRRRCPRHLPRDRHGTRRHPRYLLDGPDLGAPGLRARHDYVPLSTMTRGGG